MNSTRRTRAPARRLSLSAHHATKKRALSRREVDELRSANCSSCRHGAGRIALPFHRVYKFNRRPCIVEDRPRPDRAIGAG
jgi:hypothetical protein